MNKEEKNRLYRKAIDYYGEMSQSLVAIEEMSELTKEICKRFRGKDDYDALAEEIADVTIMLEQLQLMHSIKDLVKHQKEVKLRRLADRLNEVERPVKKDHLTEKQSRVVKAYADANMSIVESSRSLNYTRNNIEYHLKRTYHDTGLDPRNFRDLNILLKMCV